MIRHLVNLVRACLPARQNQQPIAINPQAVDHFEAVNTDTRLDALPPEVLGKIAEALQGPRDFASLLDTSKTIYEKIQGAKPFTKSFENAFPELFRISNKDLARRYFLATDFKQFYDAELTAAPRPIDRGVSGIDATTEKSFRDAVAEALQHDAKWEAVHQQLSALAMSGSIYWLRSMAQLTGLRNRPESLVYLLALKKKFEQADAAERIADMSPAHNNFLYQSAKQGAALQLFTVAGNYERFDVQRECLTMLVEAHKSLKAIPGFTCPTTRLDDFCELVALFDDDLKAHADVAWRKLEVLDSARQYSGLTTLLRKELTDKLKR